MMKINAFNLCFLCALFLLSVVATETLKEDKPYTKESKKNVLVDKLDGGGKPIDIESFDQNKPVGAGNKTREERMMEKEAKQMEREAKQKEKEESKEMRDYARKVKRKRIAKAKEALAKAIIEEKRELARSKRQSIYRRALSRMGDVRRKQKIWEREQMEKEAKKKERALVREKERALANEAKKEAKQKERALVNEAKQKAIIMENRELARRKELSIYGRAMARLRAINKKQKIWEMEQMEKEAKQKERALVREKERALAKEAKQKAKEIAREEREREMGRVREKPNEEK